MQTISQLVTTMVAPLILIHFVLLPFFLFFLVALTVASRADILSRKIANQNPAYSEQSTRRTRTATFLSSCITWVPGYRNRYRVWLHAGRSGIQMPVGAKDFSLHQNLNIGSGTNQASYSRSTKVKAAGT
jgi:hypothetical protein